VEQLKSQPAGGSAWVNPAKQPIKSTSVQDTFGLNLQGFGGGISHRSPPKVTSSAEEALKKQHNQ
jgi:hypothetical protein